MGHVPAFLYLSVKNRTASSPALSALLYIILPSRQIGHHSLTL
jgi:hypothetical protein